MEIIEHQIPANCIIYDTSDYHYGALNCARNSILEMIEEIRTTPNAFLINKGDSMESILPSDKRYSHLSVDYANKLMSPEAQAEQIVEDFMPIKDKILAWGFGNHEYKLLNTFDFGKYIASSLGVPYGGVMYKIRYIDHNKKLKFKTFHWHGSGQAPKGAKDPIQRKANRQAWLKRKLEGLAADCIYMSLGHIHHSIQVNPTTESQLYLTDNGKSVKQHYRRQPKQNQEYIPPESRWYSATSSFLKLFSPPGSGMISYGEMAGYSPAELGYHKIYIEDYRIVKVEEVFV